MPFLFRHDPIQTLLVLYWFVRRFRRTPQREDLQSGERVSTENADFLALWIVIFWILLCSIDYAPSRYYVLFFPAFAGLSGKTLSDVNGFPGLWQKFAVALVTGLFVFHMLQSALHHVGISGMFLPAVLGIVTVAVFIFLLSFVPPVPAMSAAVTAKFRRAVPVASLIVWSLVNLYWTGDWLLHLTYRQRDADRWLAENLPQNSVLIGAVAPGLSMNNRFVCVNVIEKLCNDQRPLEKYAPSPRYVLILDDRWREAWWQRNYPDIVAPEHRIHAFHGLLRPFFVIGLYRVPDEMKLER
jgi:hypothetical protein